ncbi:TonB-dependent receptor [Nisaea acidiphila]|uniref:TonB-dependent receptor n=1 Tax=Nisaea acidiphila TaxID=1862145 RepID=A0A9J7APC7_9PROT|nr:TonB-dependent receptor [Nisaea acidiphila]UUX49014.1 TonB-dependent receptor [Nisaea acidiphila]
MRVFIAAAATIATAVALPAHADEATQLDRIVISAGKEKVAIETPQSVSVVDQEDLEAAQPTTIGDVLTDLPGVKAIGSERILGESFNIRGIGTLGASDENRLIVRVDGATKFHEQYRLGSFFSDPELYKRVEVLRGPASSTLYGAGALAGVIDLTTKDAADYLQGEDQYAFRQKFEFHSNKEGLLSSSVAAARPTKNLDLLGAFIYRRANEYEDGDGNAVSGSDYEAPSGLIKGSYKFGESEAHKVTLSYQHWETEANDSDYAQTNTSSAFGTVDREVTDQTAVLKYDFQPASNELIDLELFGSYSNTEVDQSDASLGAVSTSQLFADTFYAYETWQARIENTAAFHGDGYENYLITGVSTAFQERTADQPITATNTSGSIDFHPGGESEQYGVYVQNELILWDKLTLIPGLRLDYQELTPAGNLAVSEGVDNTALSPKLAAHYQMNQNWGIFGSVSYTERLPVLDEVYDANSGNLNLDPEKSTNIEGGIAASFRNVALDTDAVTAKATLFHNDIKDLIERENTRSTYFNVGEAEIYGVEFEAAYESTFFFSRAAYTAIRGENKEDGTDLNSIPADELVLTVGGRVPDYDLDFGWRGVMAAGQDKVSGSTSETPGYTVHNLFASWKPSEGMLQGSEVRFGIENVLDKTYREHLSGDNGNGRTFRLTLAKQF